MPTISPEDPDYEEFDPRVLDDDPAEQGHYGDRDRPLDNDRGAGLPDGYADGAARQSDR